MISTPLTGSSAVGEDSKGPQAQEGVDVSHLATLTLIPELPFGYV